MVSTHVLHRLLQALRLYCLGVHVHAHVQLLYFLYMQLCWKVIHALLQALMMCMLRCVHAMNSVHQMISASEATSDT